MKELTDLLDQILGRGTEHLGEGPTSQAWSALGEAGLLRVGLSSRNGGVGGTIAEAALVVARCAQAGMSGPFTETLLLACGCAERTSMPVPDGIVTAMTPTSADSLRAQRGHGGWRIQGTASAVPWADQAGALYAVARAEAEWLIVLLRRADYRCTALANGAGEPRDRVYVDTLVAEDNVRIVAGVSELRLLTALGRSMQMLGAQRACLRLGVSHLHTREQFGRPLEKFQILRHKIVEAVGELSATEAATRAAVDRIVAGRVDREGALAIAAARVQAARASTVIAAIAHQLHGALGITHEYPLHAFTVRLWEWRDEYGTEHDWAVELAANALGHADLWRTVSAMSAPIGDGMERPMFLDRFDENLVPHAES